MGIEELVEYKDAKRFTLSLSNSLVNIDPVAEQYVRHGVKDIEMIRRLQKNYEIMRHVLDKYPKNSLMKQDADSLLETAKRTLPEELYAVIYYNYK
jgi:hypothetical protein